MFRLLLVQLHPSTSGVDVHGLDRARCYDYAVSLGLESEYYDNSGGHNALFPAWQWTYQLLPVATR